MRRNLDRRIEAITPIEDSKLKSNLHNLLQKYLKDNFYSWTMRQDGSYEKKDKNHNIYKSQFDLIDDL